MPEGDTIFRAARALNEVLAGHVVTKFETVLPQLARYDDQQPIAGRTIAAVRAFGKHLFFEFSGDLVLRTHLRMNGSWHIYRPGEPWHRRRDGMRIVIATEDVIAVGFNIQVAEMLNSRALERHEELRKLGPDLLADSFDLEEALGRLRARGDAEIANALLNQRVTAGIGNIYKSEVLFVCGVDPFRLVAGLPDEVLRKLLSTARKLLRHNVTIGTPVRRTTGSLDRRQHLWVYGRAGNPCRRCGTRIEYKRQGMDARGTYWCSRCQR